MSSEIEQRFVFGSVASLYDRFRPGYSDDLVAQVLEYAELPLHARILEVGCGTGQATRSFAAKGHRMLCLEPSPGISPCLAVGQAVARRRLRSASTLRLRGDSRPSL